MWLITTIGFYSIVEKSEDRGRGTLTVRARVREDLERLKTQFVPEMGQLRETRASDYRFRAQAPREAIAAAMMARLVGAIDYGNFKDAVARRQGDARADTYHEVWRELFTLQQRPPEE